METIEREKIKSRTLGRTRLALTELGLGSGMLGNLYFPLSDEEVHAVVAAAWNNGIRYFDTAPHYRLAERRLGEALQAYRRSDYVLSTKVGLLLMPDGTPLTEVHADYTYDGVMRSVEESLQRLKVDYMDILFIHDVGRLTHGDAHPQVFKAMLDGAYRALHELREQHVVRAIGLGVKEIEVCLEAIPQTDLDCFMLAGQYTLLEQRALQAFFPECKRREIAVIAAAPYHSGILATGPQPDSSYNYDKADNAVIERVKLIQRVCMEHGVDLPHAAICFPLLHPEVAAVVVGSVSPDQLSMTVRYLQQRVPSACWQALKQQGLLAMAAPIIAIS